MSYTSIASFTACSVSRSLLVALLLLGGAHLVRLALELARVLHHLLLPFTVLLVEIGGDTGLPSFTICRCQRNSPGIAG